LANCHTVIAVIVMLSLGMFTLTG